MVNRADEHIRRLEHLCKRLKIDFSQGFTYTYEGMNKINLVALGNLVKIAAYANGVLRACFDKFPKEVRPELQKVINECETAWKSRPRKLGDEEKVYEINRKILEKAVTAVAHSGNIFNNSISWMPKNLQPLFMKSRDICDKSVRQIMFL